MSLSVVFVDTQKRKKKKLKHRSVYRIAAQLKSWNHTIGLSEISNGNYEVVWAVVRHFQGFENADLITSFAEICPWETKNWLKPHKRSRASPIQAAEETEFWMIFKLFYLLLTPIMVFTISLSVKLFKFIDYFKMLAWWLRDKKNLLVMVLSMHV